MNKKPTVAAVQIELSTTEKNVEKILDFLEKASREKADIVCFPECSIIADNEECKETRLESSLNKIREKCKELGLWAVVGSYVLKGEKYYNRAYLIDRNGTIKYVHTKFKSWKTEPYLCEVAPMPKVIETDFGKLAFLICWDVSDQEYMKRVSELGVEIILCLADIPPGGTSDFAETIPLARAFDSNAFFVFCDTLVKDENDKPYGKTCICGPKNFLGKLYDREGMLTVELNPKLIEETKELKDAA